MKTNPRSRCFHRLGLLVVGAASAALGLLGAGCSVVSVSRPIGEKPHALVAADWEGTWVMDRGVAKVKVMDATAGQIQLLQIDEVNGEPRVVTSTVFITESGKALFATLRHNNADAAAEPFVWTRVRHEPDQVLAWWPDVERFAELVRAGKLPGRLDGSNVRLESLTAAHLAALVSGELGPVFDSDAPAVFRRVAR